MINEILQLPDKRELAYTLFGPDDGYPVIYFHGTPSSRLEPSFVAAYGIDLDLLLAKYNLRLISVDRPGMGLSTFNPKGTFISFANDVNYLMEKIKIKQCKVLCWSGGGPFALAMAEQFSNTVQAVYIITAFTQSFKKDVFKRMKVNKLYFGMAKSLPFLMRCLLDLARKMVPKKISGLTGVDHNLSAAGKLKHIIANTIQEAFHFGSRGPVYEAQMYFRDFGFKLENIKQPVFYWWGNKDKTVIRLHPQEIGLHVRDHVICYIENEGHVSIYINYLEKVLKTIAET